MKIALEVIIGVNHQKRNTFNFKDYYIHTTWNSNPINKKL